MRKEIELDEFVVMPNHLHGIIIIRETNQSAGAHGGAPTTNERDIDKRAYGRTPLRKPRTLGSFVAGFKAATTKRINELQHTPGKPFWQRNYYEHVIRNEADLTRVRQYIIDNPLRWTIDPENPKSADNPSGRTAVRPQPMSGTSTKGRTAVRPYERRICSPPNGWIRDSIPGQFGLTAHPVGAAPMRQPEG